MTPFGEKLRALRAIKGVSQAEMAADLGVSAAYLSALEHGKKGQPSWQLLQGITHYFGLVWDEAEDLKDIADISKPKVTIETSGLNPKATKAANLFANRIARLDDRVLDQILALVGERPSRGP